MKTLATADDVMPYTPNNDTVYSGALLEFGGDPVILRAPDIINRYWSVEVADPYTNNIFYIGTRATKGFGGNHAFVGRLSNWSDPKRFGMVTVPKLPKPADYQGDLAFYKTVAELFTEDPPPHRRSTLRRAAIEARRY
jgi:hypothetical protein